MDKDQNREPPFGINLKSPLMFLGVVLLSQGACTPASDQAPRGDVSPPPDATEQSAAVTGEVPGELLEKIISDLTASENLDRDAISVIVAKSVTWRDGSLGCAEPGRMYTMALVEGYRVVLQSGGREFDYRATSLGQFRRCEKPSGAGNPLD